MLWSSLEIEHLSHLIRRLRNGIRRDRTGQDGLWSVTVLLTVELEGEARHFVDGTGGEEGWVTATAAALMLELDKS